MWIQQTKIEVIVHKYNLQTYAHTGNIHVKYMMCHHTFIEQTPSKNARCYQLDRS